MRLNSGAKRDALNTNNDALKTGIETQRYYDTPHRVTLSALFEAIS